MNRKNDDDDGLMRISSIHRYKAKWNILFNVFENEQSDQKSFFIFLCY